MPALECPHCHKIVFVAVHNGDYVHDCGDAPIDAITSTEDVLVLGEWTDYTGSSTEVGLSTGVFRQGLENRNFGTRAGQLGLDRGDTLTVHGRSAATHRTRAHLEYIDPRSI